MLFCYRVRLAGGAADLSASTLLARMSKACAVIEQVVLGATSRLRQCCFFAAARVLGGAW